VACLVFDGFYFNFFLLLLFREARDTGNFFDIWLESFLVLIREMNIVGVWCVVAG